MKQSTKVEIEVTVKKITMRTCPDCGRLMPVHDGVMDGHTENGRGEPCRKAKRRKVAR